MAKALVSIQIIPKSANGLDVIALVDEAISIIDKAGIPYEVNSLETTMEGHLSELFPIITKMNERMVELGSLNVISQIKVLYQPEGITLNTLTEKYR
ncbi:thiamine-binding protein [Cytobacillus kochii]|uniref:thiamine-binding protein n=1 Tax=Cytobacillus kochii TaxID=859143 RepID=UPI0025A272A5|nr:thiamine-binding protein [Cytobacillus kochii]MDM5207053.1 thiamine-binding protein [Cytobacillus kochii]